MASIFKRKVDKNCRDKPYCVAYTDEFGNRRTVKGCTDKRATEELARKIKDDVTLRRRGLKSLDDDRIADQSKRPINEHVVEYLEACRHENQSGVHVNNKQAQLNKVIDYVEAKLLPDIETNVVGRYLQWLKRDGKSARTINQHQTTLTTFLNWCVDMKRITSNPLIHSTSKSDKNVIRKLDESGDRRRVRRAMSDEEFAVLLVNTPIENRGVYRRSVYRMAFWTGLRRNELKQIAWSDVDPDQQSLRVRREVGKAKREDFIPLRSEMIAELESIKPKDAKLNDPIFGTLPRITTFHGDCCRAREAWVNQASSDKEREERRQTTFLARYDTEGRQLDLHCLRTTLGTRMAKNRITPQIAQRIMRHSDVRITMEHYNDLRMSDDSAAMEGLPELAEPVVDGQSETTALRATGTDARSDFGPQHGIWWH